MNPVPLFLFRDFIRFYNYLVLIVGRCGCKNLRPFFSSPLEHRTKNLLYPLLNSPYPIRKLRRYFNRSYPPPQRKL